MTFRVYLRSPDQRVSDKTTTGSPDAARAAFADLVARVDLDGQRLLAVLNADGRPIAHHDFSKPAPPAPGSDPAHWWRGRIQAIDLDRAG